MNNFYRLRQFDLLTSNHTGVKLHLKFNSFLFFFFFLYVSQDKGAALNELQLLHPHSRVSGCLLLLVTQENGFDLGSVSQGLFRQLQFFDR